MNYIKHFLNSFIISYFWFFKSFFFLKIKEKQKKQFLNCFFVENNPNPFNADISDMKYINIDSFNLPSLTNKNNRFIKKKKRSGLLLLKVEKILCCIFRISLRVEYSFGK